MPRVAISVSLTPKLTQFLAAEVAAGHYQSISEAVRAAVRLLEEKSFERPPTHLARANLRDHEGEGRDGASAE